MNCIIICIKSSDVIYYSLLFYESNYKNVRYVKWNEK